MLNWVCAQTLKSHWCFEVYERLKIRLWFDMQRQQKTLKIKSYSGTYIELDLSNFEISCSAE